MLVGAGGGAPSAGGCPAGSVASPGGPSVASLRVGRVEVKGALDGRVGRMVVARVVSGRRATGAEGHLAIRSGF